MYVNLVICKSIEQVKYIFLHRKDEETYPLLGEDTIMKTCNSLNTEGIPYSISDFSEFNIIKPYKTLEKVIEMHNKNLDIFNSVIISFDCNDDFNWIAFFQAILTKSYFKVINDESDLINYFNKNSSNTYSITIVSEKCKIKTSLISKLNELQINFREMGCIYSFLTSSNIETLLSLIVKNHIFKSVRLDKVVSLIRTDYLSLESKKNGNLEIYPYKETTYENVKNILTKDPINMTSMIGHCRDDIFWLNDGAICGKTLYLDNEICSESNRCMPACVYSDTCIKNDIKILHAYNIYSRHLFVNGCYSSKVGESIFGDKYVLSLGFLDGHAVSYIGTRTTIESSEYINYYYIALLSSGISLGETVKNMNIAYSNAEIQREPPYYLIGDSTFIIGKDKHFKFEVSTLNFKENKSEIFEFKIEEDCPLISVKFKNIHLREKYYNLNYRILVSNGNQELFGVIKDLNNDSIIDIFSKEKIKKGLLRLEIYKDIYFRFSTINNFNFINIVGFHPSNKFRSYLVESQDVTLNFLKTLVFRINLMSGNINLYKKYNNINNRITNLSEMLIDSLNKLCHEKGFDWDEQCIANGLIYSKTKKNITTLKCAICGEEISEKEYIHIYNNSTYNMNICQVCGIVKSYSTSLDGVNIYFDDNFKFRIGDPFSQCIYIENKTKEPISGFVGMSISLGQVNNVSYTSQKKYIYLEPGKKEMLETTFLIGKGAVAHTYWLRGFLILNGNVCCIKKNLWISS